ncbi:unnamed protein product [Mytilus coruscus]|uniref:Uncharacterized protein n=1 Tax=Mytilus coruscus TaxID=42192 RepID=A0A6J8C401_MYTCO|nr:unnamed protein product [Mytilus coruscus]
MPADCVYSNISICENTGKKRFSKEEASAARRPLQYIMQIDGETLEEFAEQVHLLTKNMTMYFRSNDDIIDQIDTGAFLRGCQEEDRVRPLGSRLTQEEESLNELVVRRNVGRSLVIPAAVNSIPSKAIIDTAVMITLVSSSLISNIQENCESVLLKGNGPQPVTDIFVTNIANSIGNFTMH